ncbi:TRAP transporter large permease [Ornithinicoccus halotolerans]|uniref:TRAP transporter large permease n=1 Tax=Ornithinicoccus halotolerans TaxID=1748220 RepID=UPI001294F186|nr:TRAP transporter large permease [Ornithinicoccus halotolerans]
MTLWLFFGILFLCIALGVPISFALGLAAIAMMLAMDVSFAILVEQAVRGVNSFPLLAIPFFILVGEIMSYGGLARRLVAFAQSLVGFIAGGLGQVNVAASMFFGGISGSAVADTSAIGGVMIPPMKEQGYTGGHATAITVSSSVIGIIIPPSIPLILYGIVTNTSIGQLFMAGVIPGVVIAVALMVTTFLTARKLPGGGRQPFDARQLWHSFRGAAFGLVLPIIIVGGIMAGVFTPTEAAVVAVGYSLLVSMLVYRELHVKELWPILIRTGRLTGMVLFLLAIATSVAYLLTTAQVPRQIVDATAALSTNPYVVLALVALVLLLVGVVMDLTPAMIILAPILTPVVVAVGVPPVYFGLLMSLVLGIGLITPPVGTVLYVGCAVGKVRMEELLRAMWPFYLTLIGVVLLFIAVPDLVLWLPEAVQ